jgi:hypothetical protein
LYFLPYAFFLHCSKNACEHPSFKYT